MPATSSPATDDDPKARETSSGSSTRLSVTQITASGLAAVSTTVLLSFFGVAGTIIGAGLASVLTVVANFLYTRSIERTHAQLKPVVGQMVRPRPGAGDGSDGGRHDGGRPDGGTVDVLEPERGEATGEGGDADESDAGDADKVGATATPPAGRPRNAWLRLVERHGTFRVLAASAAVVFVVVMGIVVAVELLIGKPLADAVQGTEGTGTSISRTSGTDTDSPDETTDPSGPGTGSGEETTDEDAPDERGGDEQPSETTDEDGTDATPGPTEPAEPTSPAEPVEPEPAEPAEPAGPAEPEGSGDDGATSGDPTGESDSGLASSGSSDDRSGGADGTDGTDSSATD